MMSLDTKTMQETTIASEGASWKEKGMAFCELRFSLVPVTPEVRLAEVETCIKRWFTELVNIGWFASKE